MDVEILRRVNDNEIGRIAGLQQTGIQTVMLYRIQGAAADNTHKIVAKQKRSFDQDVYVASQQIIGMFIIRTEHDPVGKFLDERYQGIKVFGCTSLPDKDAHPKRNLLFCLFYRKAFMICGDSGADILFGIRAHDARGMTIHRLAKMSCQGKLGHYLSILEKHSGKIHHFR